MLVAKEDLGLSTDEFWGLTPRAFSRYVDARVKRLGRGATQEEEIKTYQYLDDIPAHLR